MQSPISAYKKTIYFNTAYIGPTLCLSDSAPGRISLSLSLSMYTHTHTHLRINFISETATPISVKRYVAGLLKEL